MLIPRTSPVLLTCLRAAAVFALVVSALSAPAARAGSAAQSAAVPVDPHFFDVGSLGPVTATVAPVPDMGGVRVFRITFPSPVVTPVAVNNTIVAFLFAPTGPGPFPAMVVLHEWLPKNLANEDSMCEAMAKAGVAALLMEEPFSLERRPVPRRPNAELLSANLPQMVAGLRQTVIDARRCLDYLQSRPEIDPARLGVAGISLGGILAPLVAGSDTRVSVVLTVVAGSDVSDIIWHSLFTRGIHKGMVRRGESFSDLLAAMAPFEADRWLHDFNPQNALMFNGRDDIFVHPWEAEDMAKALGGAPIVWLNTGHYGVALSEHAVENAGAAFLRSRFHLDTRPFQAPRAIPAQTIKLGFLIGGREILSPALAYQVLNFDRAGRYSADAQLTFGGVAAALSARLNDTSEIGIEFPLFHGTARPAPFYMIHLVL